MKKISLFSLILGIFVLSGCEFSITSSVESYSPPVYSSSSIYEIEDEELVTLEETSLRFDFSTVDFKKEGEAIVGFTYFSSNGEEVYFRVSNGKLSEEGSLILEHGGYVTNQTPINSFTNVSWEGTLTEGSYLAIKSSEYSIVDSVIGANYYDTKDVSLTPTPFVSLSIPVGEIELISLNFSLEVRDYTLPDKVDSMTFYSLNDTHGAVSYQPNDPQPGISRLSSSLRNSALINPDEVVIVSAGDMWQGSADSNLTHGALMVDWMNLVGFDSMSIGNHEFDWTSSVIEDNLERANFPFLGINIRDSQGYSPFWASSSRIIQRGGWRIGVVGAIGDLEDSIAVSSLGGYQLLDTYEDLSQEEAKRLKEEEQCDLVMLVVHNGDFYVDEEYSEYVDLIFEGHTHQGYMYVDDYGIPHSQGWSNGNGLNSLTFVQDGDTLVYESGEMRDGYELCYLSSDPVIDSLIEDYSSIIDPIKNEVLATNCPGLSRGQIANESVQAMLSFYQKKYKGTYEISAAFVNSGCSRTDLPSGTLTYGALYQALPFDNDNVLCEVSGAALKRFLSDSYCVNASNINIYGVKDGNTYWIIMLSYLSEKSEYASYLKEIERDSMNRQRDIYAEAIRKGEVSW